MSFDPTTPPVAGITQGAHVLITGGSSGIGLGLVRELVANRHVAAVTAVSRRATQSDALSALADECAGDRLKMLDCDLTDEASIERLPAWLRAHHPRLHLVINTAGILHDQNLRPERSITQLTRNALDQACRKSGPCTSVSVVTTKRPSGAATTAASSVASLAIAASTRSVATVGTGSPASVGTTRKANPAVS